MVFVCARSRIKEEESAMRPQRVKKLQLNKETIRKLEAHELKAVGGGTGGMLSIILCLEPSMLPACECTGTTGPPPTWNCQ